MSPSSNAPRSRPRIWPEPGVIKPDDLGGLTMFADNLVPHVLRLDGILRLHPGLVARIDRGELIEHGSRRKSRFVPAHCTPSS